LTLKRLSEATGIPMVTLRAACRRVGIKPHPTPRGAVFDLTAKEIKKLKKNLHGTRGRPPLR
jgi:hypothetical protein